MAALENTMWGKLLRIWKMQGAAAQLGTRARSHASRVKDDSPWFGCRKIETNL